MEYTDLYLGMAKITIPKGTRPRFSLALIQAREFSLEKRINTDRISADDGHAL